MGADYQRPRVELEQYLAILAQRDSAGELFIIVGGHAVNFWALFYLSRESRLRASLPFTSKDLDLIGTKDDAARVAANIGWHFCLPPVAGGPVEAVLSAAPGGQGLKVEFLREIKGVRHEAIVAYARETAISSPDGKEQFSVRVLDPVLLLAGKIRNAVDIEQDIPGKRRQDVKHVTMLGLCVPHFLEDVGMEVADGKKERNVCAEYITMLAALKRSYSGRLFEARHPAGINWSGLVPEAITQRPFDSGIRNALRELSSVTHSRGIRI